MVSSSAAHSPPCAAIAPRAARVRRTRRRPRRPPRAAGPRRSAAAAAASSRSATSSSSGRTRLATTVGAQGPAARRRSARSTAIAGTPLTRAFSRVASTRRRARSRTRAPGPSRAARRRSRARRCRSPSRRAPGRLRARGRSRAAPVPRRGQQLELDTARVVWWAPVPNAWPGSITRSMPSPAAALPRRAHAQPAEAPAHVDRPVECLPALAPSRRGPPRSTRRPARRPRRRAGPAAPADLAGRAVEHVLDARRRRARAPRGRRARARAARRARPRRRRARRGRRAGSRRAPARPRPTPRDAALRLAQAVAREGRRDLVGPLGQHARRDQPLGRALASASAAIAASSVEQCRFAVDRRRPRRGRRGAG